MLKRFLPVFMFCISLALCIFIIAGCDAEADGTGNVEVEPNDNTATASTISIPGTIRGAIDPGTENDYFVFNVFSDTTVTISTESVNGAPLDTRIWLYRSAPSNPADLPIPCDSSDGCLAYDDDSGSSSGCSCISSMELLPGTYYIIVDSFGTSSGEYKLCID